MPRAAPAPEKPAGLPPLAALPPITAQPMKPVQPAPVAPVKPAPITTITPDSNPLPKPLPPIGVEPIKHANSNVPRSENKVSMPQLTPPISGKTLPPREAAPRAEVPELKLKTVAPSDEELRRVLAELEQVPVSFRQMPKDAHEHHSLGRFVPLTRFDDMVLTIKEVSSAVNHIRGLNERLGHVEANTKTTIDDIAKAFEGLHVKLLALDERLFQAK